MNHDLLLLSRSDVDLLLEGEEAAILDLVREAYLLHASGRAVAPQQSLLRLPGQSSNRIIAKPAYLPSRFNTAGVKWVSSFPDNIRRAIERASAILVLNSAETGQAELIAEASLINLKRTAASAAIAAELLSDEEYEEAGFIGCGPVNWETLRFLLNTTPSIRGVMLHDRDQRRMEEFAARCGREWPTLRVSVSSNSREVLSSRYLVSIATSAVTPHIDSIEPNARVSLILHVSLRDFSPDVILSCDNVVDDADHVCSSSTSLHLAEQQVGHRKFIRCAIGDLLAGTAPLKANGRAVTMFSPFGLGTLDLAVGHFLYQSARSRGIGTRINSFFE